MLINGREVNLEGRYWVFACKYYCPKGGLNDVYMTFDELFELSDFIVKGISDDFIGHYHILDRIENNIIDSGTIDSGKFYKSRK